MTTYINIGLPDDVYSRLVNLSLEDGRRMEDFCAWILSDYAPPVEIEDEE